MDITLPPDFKEFLRLLNTHGVEYLLIGGYAVGYHGYPRATNDMDIWIAIHPQKEASFHLRSCFQNPRPGRFEQLKRNARTAKQQKNQGVYMALWRPFFMTLEMDSMGKIIYVANNASNDVWVYAIDGASGKLQPTQTISTPGPFSIALME